MEDGLREQEGSLSGFADKAKKLLTGIAGAAVVGKTISAVKDITQQSLEAYKSYEQLVGGVETLFGTGGQSLHDYAEAAGKTIEEVHGEYQRLREAQDMVLQNAANAYKTAGMSQNQYMETVTSFSASLIQSLDGDTAAAAAYADKAITDMSDNANKMGTSIEAIQTAYQGFAKQNYTMLDNLKLGYGGTKTEMERLITDAEALNSSFHAARDENGELAMSYADIVDAIHIVQDNMGITGTTAREASSTIEGSINSAKAAWENLLTGLADDNADVEKLVSNFADAVETAGQNIIPRVVQIFSGLTTMIATLAPQLVLSLGSAIIENAPMLLDAAIGIIFGLADGLIDALPDLIPAIIAVILAIIEKLTDPETIMQLIQAAFQIMRAIFDGLINAIPQVVSAIPTILFNLIEAILRFIPQLVASGTELMVEFALGIARGAVNVIQGIVDILNSIGDRIRERVEGVRQWGSDLIHNFIDGIVGAAGHLWDALKGVAQGIRNFLGFSEPEEGPLSNFHTYAPDMMELFAKGIRDNEKMLQDTVADAFDFGNMTVESVNTVKNASGEGSQNAGGTTVPIIVKCILDRREIGQAVTTFQLGKARAYG